MHCRCTSGVFLDAPFRDTCDSGRRGCASCRLQREAVVDSRTTCGRNSKHKLYAERVWFCIAQPPAVLLAEQSDTVQDRRQHRTEVVDADGMPTSQLAALLANLAGNQHCAAARHVDSGKLHLAVFPELPFSCNHQ